MRPNLLARTHRAYQTLPPTALGGASVGTSTADVTSDLARVDPGIQALQRDVVRQLVTQDPTQLDQQAQQFQTLANVPDVQGTFIGNYYQEQANLAKAQADQIRNISSKGKSTDQIAKEIAFSQGWFAFYHDYVTHANQITGGIGAPLGAGSDLDWVNSAETSYRQYLAQFQALGGTYTGPIIPTLAQIAATTDVPSSFPWTGLFIVGGLVGAYFLVKELAPEREALRSGRSLRSARESEPPTRDYRNSADTLRSGA